MTREDRWNGGRRAAGAKRRQLRGNVVIARVGLEHAFKPTARTSRIAIGTRDVSQVTQRDQVFRIEIERLFKHVARLDQLALLVERLSKHDIAAHVTRLFRQVLATERNSLNQVTGLAALISEWREVAARILLELFPELVDPGSCAHPSSPLKG